MSIEQPTSIEVLAHISARVDRLSVAIVHVPPEQTALVSLRISTPHGQRTIWLGQRNVRRLILGLQQAFGQAFGMEWNEAAAGEERP